VTVAQVTIPLWADLSAVAIASMQGAILAAKVDNHRIDLLGVGVVGTATGSAALSCVTSSSASCRQP
jgi:uncharacterized membrane protein YeiH